MPSHGPVEDARPATTMDLIRAAELYCRHCQRNASAKAPFAIADIDSQVYNTGGLQTRDASRLWRGIAAHFIIDNGKHYASNRTIAVSRHNWAPLEPNGTQGVTAIDRIELLLPLFGFDNDDAEVWVLDQLFAEENFNEEYWEFTCRLRSAILQAWLPQKGSVSVKTFHVNRLGGVALRSYDRGPEAEILIDGSSPAEVMEHQFRVLETLIEKHAGRPWPYNPNTHSCHDCIQSCELQQRIFGLSGGQT